MHIILDTNFILTCIKQKIDLFSQLYEMFPGNEIIIPERVIEELENLSKKAKKIKEKEAASLALQIISRNKSKIKLVKLEGEVDDSIVDYALDNKNVIVASLDREIKRQLKGRKMLTIKKRKRISLT